MRETQNSSMLSDELVGDKAWQQGWGEKLVGLESARGDMAPVLEPETKYFESRNNISNGSRN